MRVKRPSSHSIFAALLIFVAAVYVFWDAGRHFNETDEFWFAEIATTMVETGDFLTPRFGDSPDYNKPPLFYWLSAFCAAIFPDLELAMRIVPGLSFVGVLLFLYFIVRRSFSPRAATLAVAVFFLCYDHLYNHVYKSGVVDGLFNLEFVAIFYLNLRLREKPSALRWIGALLGAAFFTKTAFAVFPLTITMANLWLLRREYKPSRQLLLQSGGLFLAVVVPWFVLVVWANGSEVLHRMFVDQIWHRFWGAEIYESTGRKVGRPEPLYVLKHYFTYGQPWSLLIWPAVIHVWWRGKKSQGDRRVLVLCVLWIAMVLLSISLSRGRWCWYISSIYFPGAILIAHLVDEFLRGSETRPVETIWPLATTAFFMIPVLFHYNPYSGSSGTTPIEANLELHFYIMCIVLAVYMLPGSWEPIWMTFFAIASLAFAAYQVSLGSSSLLRPLWTSIALGIFLLFLHWGKRRACIAASMALAAGYLIAPLPFTWQENKPGEAKWMEELVEQGKFEDGSPVVVRGVSKYFAIALYQQFSHSYEISYNPREQTLTIRKRNGDKR